MMNRHLLWVFPLLCVILISTLSLHAQSQPPASDEFASGEANCQDAEAAENQRYKEVQLKLQIEQNDVMAKRSEEEQDCGKLNEQKPPFYKCLNDAAEEQKKASIEINKKGIEERKMHQDKLDEIETHCREGKIVPQGTSCQDVAEATENRRYEEVKLQLRIEQNDVMAKRSEEEQDCGKLNEQKPPFYKCLNDAAEEQKKASIEINKKGIEEAKTHQDKLQETIMICQAPPRPKPPLTGGAEINKVFKDFPVPLPEWTHLDSQIIHLGISKGHEVNDPIEGDIEPTKEDPTPFFTHLKGTIEQVNSPDDFTLSIDELTDLNGMKYTRSYKTRHGYELLPIKVHFQRQ